MENTKIKNIIEALGIHENEDAVKVLEEVGTNCDIEEVRELTAQALIKRNTEASLSPMILANGKGINDLSARVAMTAINELLSLKDKSKAIKILDDTIQLHSEKEIRDTARSVRALMSYSN